MSPTDRRAWMWSEAIGMLEQAERLHRQLFAPQASGRMASWEPPVDVLETGEEVMVLTALPGVDSKDIEVTIHEGVLRIAGHRTLPPELRVAAIHRLEIPQGRFERRLPLPPGRYTIGAPTMANGCLIIHLMKKPG